MINRIYDVFIRHPYIGTDTRKDLTGKIFWALRGENFDANRFVKDALAKGAVYAVSDDPANAGERVFIVKDTLKALQDLATLHRKKSKAKIIALTGSNGKTTTKELVKSVLEQGFETIATEGNLNNHIGVPLTLLRIRPGTEMAVVEMGTNHFGEIEQLCRIALPDYGYITGFGEAHLEFFGDLNGVIDAKSELYDFLREKKRTAFVNYDDPVQVVKTAGIKRYGFSYNGHPAADVQLQKAEDFPFVSFRLNDTLIRTRLAGDFHFANAGAAACIGKYFGLTLEQIKKGIEAYEPANNRSQILQKGALTLILDAYNANPTSMRAALETLAKRPGKKLAFLGDMFELGEKSAEKHREIVQLLEKLQIPAVLAGENFMQTPGNPFVLGKFPSAKDIPVQQFIRSGEEATVLIKGSRGMQMEQLLKDF